MIAVQLSRIQALELAFARIADTRMRDVPVQNLALRVQAIGFETVVEPAGEVLLGVLVTPWFMNLVRLPHAVNGAGAASLPVGQKVRREVGCERFEFIGACEEGLGVFEACSLFSPMFEFADQASATATATEILAQLRQPEQLPVDTSAVEPSRRGFLFGRGNDSARSRV